MKTMAKMVREGLAALRKMEREGRADSALVDLMEDFAKHLKVKRPARRAARIAARRVR